MRDVCTQSGAVPSDETLFTLSRGRRPTRAILCVVIHADVRADVRAVAELDRGGRRWSDTPAVAITTGRTEVKLGAYGMT